MMDDFAMTESARTLEMLMRETAWLRAVARGLVSDEDHADDIVQRVQIAALRKPPRPGSFRGWLRRVARNEATQDFRARARRETRERASASEVVERSTAEMVERVEIQRVVARCVVGLDEPHRSTLLLRYYEGLPPREIARRTGLDVRAVESRIRRGLERLRSTLDEEHGGDRGRWWSAVGALVRPTGRSIGVKLLVAAAVVLLALPVAGWMVARPGGPMIAAVPTVPPIGTPGPSSRVVEPPDRRTAGQPDPTPVGHAIADAPAPTGLRGRVIGPDGHPAPGARVVVLPARAGASFASEVTDAAGEYAVGGLPPGSVRLRATTQDGLFGERSAVEVLRGLIGQAPDVALARGATLSGTVLDVDGHAVPRVEVLVGYSAIESPLRTDAEGRFDAGVLLPGEYRVAVTAPGFVPRAAISPVTLEAGDDARVDVVLEPATQLRGRVVDGAGLPVEGARVWATRGSRGMRTGSDGRFSVDARSGSDAVRVVAEKPGYFGAKLDVVPSADVDVELALRRFGEVRGRAVDAITGAPVHALSVDLYWKITRFGGDRPFEWLTDVTADRIDEDGSFRVPLQFGTGLFMVEAHADGYAPSRCDPFPHGPHGTTTGVVIRMRRERLLQVAVVDVEGAPVAGAIVVAHEVSPRGDGRRRGLTGNDHYRDWAVPSVVGPTRGLGRPLTRGITDTSGVVRLDRLPDGALSLVARREGLAPHRLDDVRLPPDEAAAPVLVTMRSGGAIEGRVLDDLGRGLASRVVVATTADGARGEAVSVAGGHYRIEHLAPGRYRVVVDGEPRYRDAVYETFDDGSLTWPDEVAGYPVLVRDGISTSLDVTAVAAPKERAREPGTLRINRRTGVAAAPSSPARARRRRCRAARRRSGSWR